MVRSRIKKFDNIFGNASQNFSVCDTKAKQPKIVDTHSNIQKSFLLGSKILRTVDSQIGRLSSTNQTAENKRSNTSFLNKINNSQSCVETPVSTLLGENDTNKIEKAPNKNWKIINELNSQSDKRNNLLAQFREIEDSMMKTAPYSKNQETVKNSSNKISTRRSNSKQSEDQIQNNNNNEKPNRDSSDSSDYMFFESESSNYQTCDDMVFNPDNEFIPQSQSNYNYNLPYVQPSTSETNNKKKHKSINSIQIKTPRCFFYENYNDQENITLKPIIQNNLGKEAKRKRLLKYVHGYPPTPVPNRYLPKKDNDTKTEYSLSIGTSQSTDANRDDTIGSEKDKTIDSNFSIQSDDTNLIVEISNTEKDRKKKMNGGEKNYNPNATDDSSYQKECNASCWNPMNCLKKLKCLQKKISKKPKSSKTNKNI
jgi:hypothetical protein